MPLLSSLLRGVNIFLVMITFSFHKDDFLRTCNCNGTVGTEKFKSCMLFKLESNKCLRVQKETPEIYFFGRESIPLYEEYN